MHRSHGTPIIGDRYGRLLVIARTPSPGAKWSCRCDCGADKLVESCDLRTSRVQSCGCLDRDRRRGAGNANFKHGQSSTRLFSVWKGMHNRCRNPNQQGFRNYGGRGIRVCDRWGDFPAFAEDMGSDYRPGLTIERRDVNGHYEPGNCVWLPFVRQAVNRRTTPFVDWRGVRMAFADAWRDAGQVVRMDTAWSRYHRYGWTLEAALTTARVVGKPARTDNACIHGHTYTQENAYLRVGGGRGCRACDRDRSAAYRQRKCAA